MQRPAESLHPLNGMAEALGKIPLWWSRWCSPGLVNLFEQALYQHIKHPVYIWILLHYLALSIL